MTLTEEEKQLLKAFTALDPNRKQQAIGVLQIMARNYPAPKEAPARQLRLVSGARG